jgi:hypothetical protein
LAQASRCLGDCRERPVTVEPENPIKPEILQVIISNTGSLSACLLACLPARLVGSLPACLPVWLQLAYPFSWQLICLPDWLFACLFGWKLVCLYYIM